MIVTIATTALGAAFFLMSLGMAGSSFDATYVIPALLRLESLTKASNLNIDYGSYGIKNHNRAASIGTILATVIPLAGMIYVAYRFEAFESVMATICITVMIASVLLMLSSNGKQRKFTKLFIDVKSFVNVEGIDNIFYRSIRRFQNLQMLLIIVTMVTMMLAL